MNENKDILTDVSTEKEIGWLDLIYQLWDNRRKIIKWSIVGAIAGIIVAFSIPKEYTATAKLAPESTGARMSSSIAALASIAGYSGNTYGSDAVEPAFYPEVVGSVPFLTGLFSVDVETKEGGNQLTLQQYMATMKGPWWMYIIKSPIILKNWIKSLSEKDEQTGEHVLDTFRLTPKENTLLKALESTIDATVDPKTDLITISVTLQDPLVAAIVADTVVSRLQAYITEYRTDKARLDLEYAEKINEEARERYYLAQKALADYSDRNQGLATQSARITHDRLENEATLAFTLYNQTAQRVQAAQALVQAQTPVYAIVSPPTVPLNASFPSKIILLAGFTLLGALTCIIWTILLQPEIKARLKTDSDQQ